MNQRSNIPLASAERQYRTPHNGEDFEKARAAAYRQAGVVTINLNEPLPFGMRELIASWAEKRWGARSTKVNFDGRST